MSVGAKIQILLADLGMSQAELARRIGITQPSVNALLRGNAQSSKHLHKIARILGTTPEYLTGETDDPSEGAQLAPTPEAVAEQLDAAMIEEVDLTFGLGGAFNDGAVSNDLVPFPREWLREFAGNRGEAVSVARARGDSMEPTIKGGYYCLFDRSKIRIDEQDALWALAVGELLMIKRVRAVLDGSYMVLSDNSAVPAERMHDGEMHVIGRVIAVIQRK